MKIEIDNLEKWLIDHHDEVAYVALTWTWSPNIIDIELEDQRGKIDEEDVWLHAEFSFIRRDDEYCFYGDVDKAIEYAGNYSQWDERDFEFENGMLIGEVDAENYFESHDDADTMNDIDVMDLKYDGLFYYQTDRRGNQHSYRYEGPTWRDLE